ncbi:MAG: chemotaxis response regulator protein-glutamate methylesterase [Nitriliruptoraceae bacterium]
MDNARVLVVDDAVVVRKIITDLLDGEAGLEVAGTASNGRAALEQVERLGPDLVTLDVEMPVMDGLTTLKQLRAAHPTLPVIMFSTLTERGASVTMEALMNGANDYVTKPANVGSLTQAKARIRQELMPKVRGLTGRHERGGAPTASPPGTSLATASAATPSSAETSRAATSTSQLAAQRAPRSRGRVEVVVLGVSTGGPNALARLVPALPRDLAAPVLIVQHMPPMFTRLLAERLDTQTPLRVREAGDGQPLAAGEVLIAPGGRHLEVSGDAPADVVTRLSDAPPENSCRPSVDVLFRSAAAAFEGHTLAVVLTGMGADGLKGAERIRQAGGTVLAQDHATSVVWGMPGAVAEAGLAEELLPLAEIAPRIGGRVAAGGSGRTEVPA